MHRLYLICTDTGNPPRNVQILLHTIRRTELAAEGKLQQSAKRTRELCGMLDARKTVCKLYLYVAARQDTKCIIPVRALRAACGICPSCALNYAYSSVSSHARMQQGTRACGPPGTGLWGSIAMGVNNVFIIMTDFGG